MIEMKCLFCNHEYQLYELVFTTPAICPFCVLGHGNNVPVYKELKTNKIIQIAVYLAMSPRMIHRLKCIVPSLRGRINYPTRN
jgi:hypothetical protein